MNIMLIDDDEAIRDMLQDIIEDYELGTVVASLPSAATLTTTELVARHIDLLIIDMLMPDCDGIDSVRRFHENELCTALRFLRNVMHSSFSYEVSALGRDLVVDVFEQGLLAQGEALAVTVVEIGRAHV